jgi:hypothetical protein
MNYRVVKSIILRKEEKEKMAIDTLAYFVWLLPVLLYIVSNAYHCPFVYVKESSFCLYG